MLVGIEVQVALGFPVFGAEHAVGRGELGHDQAAAGQVTDKAAEDGVSDTGHGRKDGGRRYPYATERHLGRDRWRSGTGCIGSWCGRRRIVPVLAHLFILAGLAKESPRRGEGSIET